MSFTFYNQGQPFQVDRPTKEQLDELGCGHANGNEFSWHQCAMLWAEIHALKQERDALFIEYDIRAHWIAKMNAILGYDNSDGFHSSPDPFEIAQQLVELAEFGKKWRQDSSLKTWFPFTNAELVAMRNNLSACIDRLNHHISP